MLLVACLLSKALREHSQKVTIRIEILRQGVIGVRSSSRMSVIDAFLVRVAAIASAAAIFICRTRTVEEVDKGKARVDHVPQQGAGRPCTCQPTVEGKFLKVRVAGQKPCGCEGA